jgi:hypothetical protein
MIKICYNKVYYFFKNLFKFFKNVWTFKKELWEFQPWDYTFNLMLLKTSLEQTCTYIEKYGKEIFEVRKKKVQKMKRAIKLLNHFIEDDFIDIAEKELGYKLNLDIDEKVTKKDTAIFDLTRALQIEYWEELWSIIEGNTEEKFDYYKQDGSDMKGWWD